MTDQRFGVLRRLGRRRAETAVGATDNATHAPGAIASVSVRDARPRSMVTVTGEIRSVTLRPRADVPALDIELWDGSDALHLVWLGRRHIAGIRPGLHLRATGRVTEQRNVPTIFNPAYEVLAQGGPHD